MIAFGVIQHWYSGYELGFAALGFLLLLLLISLVGKLSEWRQRRKKP